MLYLGVLSVCALSMRVLIDLAFRQPVGGIHFELLGHFVGSCGIGALASAPLLSSNNVAVHTWLRVTMFGGISGLVFGLIVEIKHGPPIDIADCILSAFLAACLFPLVRWLASKG